MPHSLASGLIRPSFDNVASYMFDVMRPAMFWPREVNNKAGLVVNKKCSQHCLIIACLFQAGIEPGNLNHLKPIFTKKFRFF